MVTIGLYFKKGCYIKLNRKNYIVFMIHFDCFLDAVMVEHKEHDDDDCYVTGNFMFQNITVTIVFC